jgi:two-component system nitrogen regulation sensor histidine kinase NtrY
MTTDSEQEKNTNLVGSDKDDRNKDFIATASFPNRKWARFILFARRFKFTIRIEVVLSILAVASAIVTSVVMSTKSAPVDITASTTMRILLLINMVLLLGLGVSIGRWFVKTRFARKNAAGSKLHTRMTSAFMAIAMIPPIIMAIFSTVFIERGIQNWFNEPVRAALGNSLEIADTYVLEHRANIEKDMLAIAFAYNQLDISQRRDLQYIQSLAAEVLTTRNLNEVLLIEEDSEGQASVIARASQSLELTTNRVPRSLIASAKNGPPQIVRNDADKTVLGIMRIDAFLTPTYLYVARDLSPNVLQYLEDTRNAVAGYTVLESERSNILFQFNVVFLIIAFLILLAAIWVGLWFSSRLVTPLSNLVNAAERVGEGDLEVRVPYVATRDEVGTLSRAFNRMTDQLANHQDDLLEANLELDDRRRFLEDVLEGVSAGVLGLQHDERIFLPNRSAAKLLGLDIDAMMKKKLSDVVPEFSEILRQGELSLRGESQGHVVVDVLGERRTFMVRVFVEHAEDNSVNGYVVTFDDLTEQLADQRTAAWADVARRIAHEIKNPLTPIQLSAERLKRKYLDEIESDKHVFSKCTDTIIRQVGDLRHMVDEFSSFARMPAPTLKETDIVDVVKQAVFLQDVAATNVEYETELQKTVQPILCDSRLIGQALTNLLKNALESIQARVQIDKEQSGGNEESERGLIKVFLLQTTERTEICVEDNGKGLPNDQKDRLMEPYVTTRTKGTGLGLAIVKRIMEEHGGTARIADKDPKGARVLLTFSHKALQSRAEKASDNPDNDIAFNAAE